jgi:hypothetical protein
MISYRALMTYSKALAYGQATETYTWSRWLNADRTPLTVFVWNRMRFRSDTKKRTTVKALVAEGWKLAHRTELPK